MPLSIFGITILPTRARRGEQESSKQLSALLSSSTGQIVELRKLADERGRDLAKLGPQLAQTADKLTATQALAAEKQREIAALRARIVELEARVVSEAALAREERQKLMDWIAKCVSNGVPIFAEMPKPVVEPEPAKAASERVPTEVEEAISRVGRRPRAIVNHISKKHDVDFEAAMAGQGIKRIFEEDRITAEAEAEVINEAKSA